VVGEKNQDFILLRVVYLNPPEGIRAFFFGQRGQKLNEFVFEDISVLGDLPLAHGFILGIVLHPGDEIDSPGGPLAKEPVIIIRPVVDDDGSRIKLKSLGNFDIGDASFGNTGIGREIALVIQDQVQLDGPFGPAEVGPVKKAKTEIDDGGIQGQELIFEPEFLLPIDLGSNVGEETEEDLLIQLPGAMGVGVG
jgi:hypothetical protein